MREIFTDKNFITSKVLLLAKIFLIISLVVFFLPLIILPFFNHAYTDDYFGGYYLNKEGFINYQEFVYNQWAGRFAATFVGALFINHGFLYEHYYLHSLSLLVLNFLSLFFLINTINKYILEEKWSLLKKVLFTLIFLALEICCVPQVVTFIFWFSSSLSYHPPVIFIQLEIALFILLLNSNKRTDKIICGILLPFLVFFINGFNELYIIIQFFLFLGIFWLGLGKKVSKFFIITILLFYVTSALIVFFAPGDKVRMEGIVPKGIAVGAIAVLYQCAQTLWGIFKNPLTWFMLAIAFEYGKRKKENLGNSVYIKKLLQPLWLMPLAIILFLIVSIGLPVVALKGGLIPERYLNGVSYFVLLLLIIYFFMLGVHRTSTIFAFPVLNKKIVFTILFAVGLLCNIYITEAYKSLISAPMYNTILSEREAALKEAASKNKIAEVDDYNLSLQKHLQADYSSSTKTLQQYIQQKPPLLFFEDDLATEYSINTLKNYYGLDSIIVRK
jgi:hypothetical protein